MPAEEVRNTWWLEPRDPLVFGDGGRAPAFAAEASTFLPPQATAAGLVRTALLEASGGFTAEAARRALAVSIRGPFLVREREGEPDHELWLPAPVDVAVLNGALLPATLEQSSAEEGTLWPEPGLAALRLLTLPAKVNGRKTERLRFPFWPCEAVVAWALGDRRATETALMNADLLGRPKRRNHLEPVAGESRVHVAIQEETGTAKPQALFSSRGLRFAQGFGLALEVTIPAEARLSAAHLSPTLRVLGGEARTARAIVTPGALLPSFEHALPCLTCAAERALAQGALGLRVQLATPALGEGWTLPWPEGLHERLYAVAMNRFTPVSGWDLQARGPRAVRRLVPAGSVFLFGPFANPAEVLALAETLWGKPLPAPTTGGGFLAAPAADGYGITLAFPCSLSTSTPSEAP